MTEAHEKDAYAQRCNRILEVLGPGFDPQPVSIIALRVFPDHPAWRDPNDKAAQTDLHYQAGQHLAVLAMESKVMKVGKRRWARKASWEDWRDWLCVVMDAASEGDPEYVEVAKDALSFWSHHVGIRLGAIPEDWEPVAVQAVTLFCSKEWLSEPWVLSVLRRSAAVVWRPDTAAKLRDIVAEAGAEETNPDISGPLNALYKALGSGRFGGDGGT